MAKRKTVAQVEDEQNSLSVLDYLAKVPDPRIERTRLHSLTDILALSLCAVICGADTFVSIELFGNEREDWLRTFLDLPHGIPSHDTIGRVFAALDPKALESGFRSWTQSVSELTQGEVVAIDGKTLRRSFHKMGSSAFTHMVSAWATSNRLVLGQVKTEEKSNEITAIPELLRLLYLKGCIVTIDAMGCQKEIAGAILERGADYCLGVKDNQPTLRADIERAFATRSSIFAQAVMPSAQTHDKGHGRTEVRRCWTLPAEGRVSQVDSWPGLKTIILVETERTVGDKTSTDQRYYICSRAKLKPSDALPIVRAHWGIENELHWVLDVAFREDDSRIRAHNAAECFAVIRHLALNLLKHAPGKKVGIKIRRQLAGWSNDFLRTVLGTAARRE